MFKKIILKRQCFAININQRLAGMSRGAAQAHRLAQAHLLSSAGGCGAANVDRTSDLRPAADSAFGDALIASRRGSEHVEEEEPPAA